MVNRLNLRSWRYAMPAPAPRSSQHPIGLNTWNGALPLALAAGVALYPRVVDLPVVWRTGMHEAPWAVALAAASVLLLVGATIRYVAAVARRRSGPLLAPVIAHGILAIFFLLLMPLTMQSLAASADDGLGPPSGPLELVTAGAEADLRRVAHAATFGLALCAATAATGCICQARPPRDLC